MRAMLWLLQFFRAFEGLVLELSAGQIVPKPFVLDVFMGDLEGPQAFPFIAFVLKPEESIAVTWAAHP